MKVAGVMPFSARNHKHSKDQKPDRNNIFSGQRFKRWYYQK